ncbi:hypothetical protein XENOCAPTIV_004761 [Xenoophorus captivus]|uniref:Uncharacterized protein n=1 Tax=Xenoophorus captivus TaxID=1517983 RepID=A0ABV0RZ49_9TELE
MDTVKHHKSRSTGDKESKSRKNPKHFTDVHGLPCIEKIVSSVEDTPEPISTDIIGTIPNWIHGNFLRNGPGKFEIGNHRVPPTKEAEEETLEGTTLLCSIPAEDKTKPSYYHSFGQSNISCECVNCYRTHSLLNLICI